MPGENVPGMLRKRGGELPADPPESCVMRLFAPVVEGRPPLRGAVLRIPVRIIGKIDGVQYR